MENSKRSKENIIEKEESISDEKTISCNKEKDKDEENGLNEVGEFIGERRIKKDPEEFRHLKEVCAAFFNYQVISKIKIII